MKNCKTPETALSYAIRMSLQWHEDVHLRALANLISANNSSLDNFAYVVQRSSNESRMADKVTKYVIFLLGKRAGTLSKHDSPPHCYAGALSDDRAISSQALEWMLYDWKLLVSCESSERVQAALVTDLQLLLDPPTRLALVLNFTGATEEALRYLRTMFKCLPDSKCVEDARQVIRLAQKARGRSEKLNAVSIQHLMHSSKVLSSRDLRDAGKFDRAEFLEKFPKVRPCGKYAMVFKGRSHKLPKRFSEILSNKRQWPAVSETNLLRSCAGLDSLLPNESACGFCCSREGWMSQHFGPARIGSQIWIR